MKKSIAISILLVFLSVAAFAQLKVGFTSDNTVDLFHFVKDTGDQAKANKVKGVSNFLSSNWWDNSELRLTFTYTGENFKAFLEVKGDDMVTRGSDFYSNSAPNFVDVLSAGFGDYYVQGNAGIIRGYVGNEAKRGVVDRFQNFNDFLKYKINNYGAILYTASAQLKSTDTNNLSTNSTLSSGAPWLGFGVDLKPIAIDLASNIVESGYFNGAWSADKINMVARVEGKDIADMINFDVVYRINGGDTNNQERGVGGGQWNNQIGVYANINAIKTLGIGVGYTAAFTAYEATTRTIISANDTKVDVKSPLFSGIDLRFCFTGVEKLKITFNNNLSFAGAKSDGSLTKQIRGVDGTNNLNSYVSTTPGVVSSGEVSQSWFAMYNALGADYKLTDQLTATLQLANLLGVRTFKTDTETKLGNTSLGKNIDNRTLTTESFEVALSTAYAFTSNVTFEAGLAMLIDTFQYKGDLAKASEGVFYFGVPLRFKVKF